MTNHLTAECPLLNLRRYFRRGDFNNHADEICEQLWAEIYKMKTLRYRDFNGE